MTPVFNPWSPGRLLMVQKMAISSLALSLTLESLWFVYDPEDGYIFPYPRLLRINLSNFFFSQFLKPLSFASPQM